MGLGYDPQHQQWGTEGSRADSDPLLYFCSQPFDGRDLLPVTWVSSRLHHAQPSPGRAAVSKSMVSDECFDMSVLGSEDNTANL